jgi:glutaminyl-peptide cyclotransferase
MRRLHVAAAVVFAAILTVSVCVGVILEQPAPANRPNFTVQVVATYPHDSDAFTEGLVFDGGSLFESTGKYGSSELRRVDLQSGSVLQRAPLSGEFFGEGITVVGDRIVQFTWQNRTGFVYGKDSFAQISQFTYATEGWGLTFDGKNLVMSDGSATLYFLKPETFQVERQISVHDQNQSVTKLNELEYVDGNVYANVWQQGKIAIINPTSGAVVGWVELGTLEGSQTYQANGIAYDQQSGSLYITGKNWQHLYQITLTPQK